MSSNEKITAVLVAPRTISPPRHAKTPLSIHQHQQLFQYGIKRRICRASNDNKNGFSRVLQKMTTKKHSYQRNGIVLKQILLRKIWRGLRRFWSRIVLTCRQQKGHCAWKKLLLFPSGFWYLKLCLGENLPNFNIFWKRDRNPRSRAGHLVSGLMAV